MHGFTRRWAVAAALVVGALVASPLSASGVTPTPTPTDSASTSSATPVPAPPADSTGTPTPTVTPSTTVPDAPTLSDPANRASRIIVKYRDGLITAMDAKGRPFGWNSAITVPVVGGADIAEGMTSFTLSKTVDMATARKVAAELALNPAIEWAEPDGWRQIVADVTPMAATPVDVTVSGTTGSATKSGAFTYSNTVVTPAPSATSLSVTQGPAAGGTSVTLTGTNLTGATSVTVGGTAGTSLSVLSSTQVRFTTPAKAAGTYDVVVTTPGGSSTLSAAFTYVAAPTLLSTPLSQTTGSTAGGQSLTISGSNLASTTSVTFGGTPATSITSKSASQVVVVTPARAVGAVSVVVTTPGGSVTAATQFTYAAPATVTSLSPTSGATGGGTSVTITGTNLLSTTSVTIGGASASISSKTASTVVVTSPPHATGLVDVVVTGPTGSVTKANAFNYIILPPTLTSLTPKSGSTAGGTLVTLSGSRLGDVTSVTFGGTTAQIQSQSATTINVITPARAAGAVSVVATGPGGTSTPALSYSYFTPPSASSLSPRALPLAGGIVTISGTGMTGATSVTVGGSAGASLRVISATQVSFTAPAKAAGSYDVVVTGPGGSSTLSGALTYVGTPTLATSPLSQTVGSSLGGQSVTITGTNLALTSSVTFGGTPATISSRSATQVVVQTPAKAASITPVTLVVTTPGGAVSKTSAFTYAAPATITTVSPAKGGTGGGTSVTLAGTNLQYASLVTFDGIAATLVSKSATSIVVRTPTHAAGVVNIVVTSSTGTLTKSNAFTYDATFLPVVTSLSPTSGTVDGGTTVSLSGSNLGDVTSVTFGGVPATVTSKSETRIVVSSPSKSAGAVNVVAIGPGGSSSPRVFSYKHDPIISSVSPTSGRLTGGTLVTITGTRLTGTTSVKFGTASSTALAGTAVTVVSDSQVTVRTPASTAGSKHIYLTTPGGTVIKTNAFTYSSTATTSVASLETVTPSSAPVSNPPILPSRLVSDSSSNVASDSEISPMTTDCPDSTATARIQRCYDDPNNDWGFTSQYEEIAYSNFYVSTSNRSKLIMEVVPEVAIPTNTWLQNTNAALRIYLDTNNDGSENFVLVAPRSSVLVGQTVNALIWDVATQAYRNPGGALTCSATLTRMNTAHPLTGKTSWWQFSADWACLFGSNANSTRVDAFAWLTETAYSPYFVSEDVSPEGFSGNVMNLPTALVDAPVVSTVSPNQGELAGGTTVTISGSGLANMTKVTFGGRPGRIVSTSDTQIVVVTPAQASGAITPTESAYTNGTLWGLTNSTFGIKPSPAWAKTQGEPSIVVAVLDTGITAHPDLGGQVAGYDMVDSDGDATDPGDWCASNGRDSSWHGTHVAGTINAALNGVGSVGVAPGVKVEPVRVLGQCGGSTSDIVAGIIWAAGGSVSGLPTNPNPANVINMSLGGLGACSASEQLAINFARSQGVTVVVAAGNENDNASLYSPASCDGVITVAATDSSGKRGAAYGSPFSNYGSAVEIAAPGVSIYSTVATGATTRTGYGYASWPGTSMATPHVAGVVALMLSRDPTLTPDQVLSRIQSTASSFGGGVCDSVSPSKTCGVGIINAGAAVQ